MRLLNTITAITIASLCILSCEKIDTGSTSAPGAAYELTKAQNDMVNKGNDFAFNLLEAISEHKDFAQKDFMASPLSISFVLGALDNGANGKTSEEIRTVLGFHNSNDDQINEYSRTLLNGCSGLDECVEVKIANAIVVNEQFKLNKDFKDNLETYYDAYIRSLKFDNNALKAINEWCDEHTNGLIPEILDRMPENSRLVALNSIYFKGEWAIKFDKNDTMKKMFCNIDGSSSRTSMMCMENMIDYASNDVWSTVRLPYGNGSYNMYILLPHEDRHISDIIRSLDATTWENIKYNMLTRRVNLELPSFETATDINLNDIMISLGMTQAFTPMAEFDRMFANNGMKTFLGLLKQKSKIIVDEEGTEAAAVTVGISVETSIGPKEEPEVINFHANRPFVYMIQEKSSNAIFFIGTEVMTK